MSFRLGYGLGFVNGDTDGFGGSSPAYSYDLSDEYGRTVQDSRHFINLFGNFTLPWAVSINPIITARSGTPFNITRGIDANGDGFFTERPTFAALQDRCSQINSSSSFCDIGSNAPTDVIPRNYGEGPAYLSVSLRIGKNFGFGRTAASRAANGRGAGRPATGTPVGAGGVPGGVGGVMIGRPGGGGGGRGGFGGGGFGGGGDVRKPYNLNVGIFVTNLFNTVNLNNPVGSLNSFRFGQSTATAGGFGGGSGPNRRIELSMRFNF
jgi:hypothetical protein